MSSPDHIMDVDRPMNTTDQPMASEQNNGTEQSIDTQQPVATEQPASETITDHTHIKIEQPTETDRPMESGQSTTTKPTPTPTDSGNTEDSANNKPSTQSVPTMSKNNILEAIEDFDSTIPDAVVHHFLNCSGMQTSDQRIVRLIAVAAQKFIHDIVSDSLQHCKLRGVQSKKTKDKKYSLAIEDLAAALAEYGIEVRRQQYIN